MVRAAWDAARAASISVRAAALDRRRNGCEVRVMKSLIDLRGQAGAHVRPPLNDVRPDKIPELKKMLAKWKAWA